MQYLIITLLIIILMILMVLLFKNTKERIITERMGKLEIDLFIEI